MQDYVQARSRVCRASHCSERHLLQLVRIPSGDLVPQPIEAASHFAAVRRRGNTPANFFSKVVAALLVAAYTRYLVASRNALVATGFFEWRSTKAAHLF